MAKRRYRDSGAIEWPLRWRWDSQWELCLMGCLACCACRHCTCHALDGVLEGPRCTPRGMPLHEHVFTQGPRRLKQEQSRGQVLTGSCIKLVLHPVPGSLSAVLVCCQPSISHLSTSTPFPPCTRGPPCTFSTPFAPCTHCTPCPTSTPCHPAPPAHPVTLCALQPLLHPGAGWKCGYTVRHTPLHRF